MNIKRGTGRTLLGLLVLITLVAGALAWRASWIAHRLLRSWVATTVRETSGDVYEVAVGRVRFNFPLRRVSVDSIRVTTNSLVNARRQRPLAALSLFFHDCKISGVNIITLLRSRGLIADALGCSAVNARFAVPPGAPDTTNSIDPRGAMLVLQQSIQLPAFAPQVRISRVDFPRVGLDFEVRHAKGGASQVQLERFRWHMIDFAMDPADAKSAARPMFSSSIELAADSLVVHPDSNTVIRVASLSASLTDSTLDARGFSINPVLNRGAFALARPYRRKYTTLRVERFAARGVNVGGLLLGKGLRARTATVDTLTMDITNDHVLPPRPGAEDQYRTPQQWIANLDRPVQVDSLVMKHGQVVYRLRNSDRDGFGIIRFARINALALHINTTLANAADRAPMRIAATTMFQDSALLSVSVAVPLRARRFDMTFRGTLGPLHSEYLNQFVEATTPIRIVRGEVISVDFRGTVSDGLTRGTVTPVYNDLTFAINREGSTGLTARGGFIGGVARTMASFTVNWQKIYGWNPGDPRNKPRVGRIHHAFSASEALPDYLWYAIRDGLMTVMQR